MVQELNRDLIARVTEQAKQSPRKRMNYNFHSGPNDNPHRFLNVMLKGTYVRPHRHLNPPKTEGFLALEGTGAVVTFDDHGNRTATYTIGQDDRIGVDIPVGIWHTVLVTSDVLVCYEVKPGPWDPTSDKEFAEWAPEEGTPEAGTFLHSLLLAV